MWVHFPFCLVNKVRKRIVLNNILLIYWNPRQQWPEQNSSMTHFLVATHQLRNTATTYIHEWVGVEKMVASTWQMTFFQWRHVSSISNEPTCGKAACKEEINDEPCGHGLAYFPCTLLGCLTFKILVFPDAYGLSEMLLHTLLCLWE